MLSQPLLFRGGRLSDKLEELRQRAYQLLLGEDPDEFLATPEADVTSELVDVANLDCPTLRQEAAYLLDPTDMVEVPNVGEPYSHGSTLFTLVVPFEGDPEVFKLGANSSVSSDPPRGKVDGNELHVFAEYRPKATRRSRADPVSGNAAKVRANFDAQLDKIERFLDWSRRDIARHRQAMEAEIPRLVANRRAKLLADRQLHANIGFPVKRRPDAGTYVVPFRRRQVALGRRQANPAQAQRFEPEPALLAADYEAALAVLRNMRNALERSPSTTERLGEEQVRDLLLVSLNAQFEGKAAGEVFNGAGKTDILIRVDDRNVFVGECKIWNGPKTVTDAVDQLLGYLVWRDTKAALLLFIRAADVSTVTAKAVAKIEEHPNYKRRGKPSTEERYDFVLHATGDPAREIHLALLPFLIAGKDRPPPAAT